MARVPYPSRDEFPEAHLAAYDRMQRDRGNPTPNIFLALANIPNLLDPLLSFTQEMREGAVIEARLRELAIMTVGLTTGCDYEFAHHWNPAIKAGLRRKQLEQLANAETSEEFDAGELAIIRYAREATLSLKVSDTTWSTLLGHFGLRRAMDIVMAVAWYNAVARMLLPLEIESEGWVKPL